MKRVALLSFCLLMISSLAFAQGGQVGVFSDVAATNCNYADASVGLGSIYVVHITDGVAAGAQGSQFKIDLGAGVNMTVTGVQANYPLVIGEPYTGVAVTYNVCAALPTLVYTLNFFNQGTSVPCSYVSVIGYAQTGGAVRVLACSGIEYNLPAGGQLIVNSDGSCDCDIPVDDATWGEIKALYSAE